jgi:ferritin
MLSKNIEKAFNEQIKNEFYSGYIYLAMASYFMAKNLDGFANFFIKQEAEERVHAFKFIHFLNEKGNQIEIPGIDKPGADFKSIEDIFEKAYKHEQFVTKKINELMDLAIKENDHSARSFLTWFVDEQVEEESSMLSILEKIKMVQGSPNGIFMLDAKLGERK